VGNEDGAGVQSPVLYILNDRVGITRVDDGYIGQSLTANKPDIIVVKGGELVDFHHTE
jgi:hypothetical protein